MKHSPTVLSVVSIMLAVLFLTQNSHAQTTPTLEWQRCFGGSNNDNYTDIRTNPTPSAAVTGTRMIHTKDGGYLLVSSTSSVDGDIDISQRHQDRGKNTKDSFYNSDIWIVKLSTSGETEWEKYYGGNAGDTPFDVKQTYDGGYVLCGETNSFSDDFYLDTAGLRDYLYGRAVGESPHDIDSIYIQTTGQMVEGIYDGFVLKLDSRGNKEWVSRIGGTSHDMLRKIVQTSDGGFLAVGETRSNEESWGSLSWINHPFDPLYNPYHHQRYDGLVVKITSDGKKAWNRLLGGSDDEWFYDIVSVGNDKYTILGQTDPTGAGGDSLQNGDVTLRAQWRVLHDIWLVEINGVGNVLRQKCFGADDGMEYPRTLQQSGAGYVFSAITNLSTQTQNHGDIDFGYGLRDVWIVRLDTGLNIVEQNTFGGSKNEEIGMFSQTSHGTYLFVGTTASTDGDLLGLIPDSSWLSQIWVGELDEKFDILWQKTLGGSLPDAGNMIFEAENGYMVLGSVVSNDGDVSGNHWGKYGPTSDIWLAKLTTLQSVASTLPQEVNFAYPNPSSGEVNLRIHSEARVKSVEFINPLGMKISAPYRLSGDILTAETATLSSGMYILEVSYENSTIPTERRKFIKE